MPTCEHGASATVKGGPGLVQQGLEAVEASPHLGEQPGEHLRALLEYPLHRPPGSQRIVAPHPVLSSASLLDGYWVQASAAVHGDLQEAAIAALHDDAASAEETDWPQILAWYDDLVALTEDPVRRDPAAVLGRAVAIGHVRGAAAGLRETDRLREVIGERHRWHAVRGHLHELDGDLPAAATAYAEAARRATNVAERDHLVRQAAHARAAA